MKGLAQVVVAAALAWAATVPARAQEYPTAPVHLVSGFPAGTTADISARVVGARIGQILGQQLVVENRPGAASSLAAAVVARAPKDGYTLLIGSAANVINAAMNPNLTFDFVRDFTPITLLTSTPTVLVVNPELGVKSVKDLVALAKAKPDSISFGSSGVASSTHLALELFKRSPIIPDLPTMIEAGIPGFESVLWFGLVAPAGTPQPIIDKLARAANEALKSDEVGKSLQAQSIARIGGTPDEFRRYIDNETTRWTAVVTGAGLRK